MIRLLVIAVLLGDDSPPERPGDLVWRTTEVVEKGGDKTFMATGTRKGHRYVFRSRGLCQRKQWPVWVPYGMPRRPYRQEWMFGLDFRVTFGGQPSRGLEVGEGKPAKTELTFTADRDDLPIRIEDHWEQPAGVQCTIDDLQVVVAEKTAD